MQFLQLQRYPWMLEHQYLRAHPGPPGWGLCDGLTAHPHKKNTLLQKRQRKNQKERTPVLRRDGPAGVPDGNPDNASPAGPPQDLMNPGGQSRKEASRRTPVLSTRTTTKIGAWNVQTMYETGELHAVEGEFERYGLAILGISEARWNGKGKRRLRNGKLLLYSGREEGETHQSGVALML